MAAEMRSRAIAFAFGAFAWTLFAACAGALWLPISVTSRRGWGRALARRTARFLLWATRTRVEVEGSEHLPDPAQPCVLVCNHSSALDAIVLLGALPREFAFVAKAELARRVLLRIPLARIGTLFVQRRPRSHPLRQTERAAERIRAGDSLLFFPEGTYTAEPEMLPFRRGAFATAARAGVAVVPIAVLGTCAMLPPGSRLPRRGAIRLAIGHPLVARSLQRAEIEELRDSARAFILAQTGGADRCCAARADGRLRPYDAPILSP